MNFKLFSFDFHLDIRCQTSDLSWWPKQSTFESLGLYFGYWLQSCEEWFQKRARDIVEHRAKLNSAEQWFHVLKFNKSQTKKIIKRNHDAAVGYLQDNSSLG